MVIPSEPPVRNGNRLLPGTGYLIHFAGSVSDHISVHNGWMENGRYLACPGFPFMVRAINHLKNCPLSYVVISRLIWTSKSNGTSRHRRKFSALWAENFQPTSPVDPNF